MFHTHAIIHVLGYGLLWIIALYFLRLRWNSRESAIIAFNILLASIIDIDHLLATPIYDPLRCSIGFHPLHSYWIMPVYIAGIVWRKTRWFCLAIMVHLGIDGIACL